MTKVVETLQTDRLFFRGINETDAKQIVDWRSDPAVYRYFKFPHRITMTEHMQWYNNHYLQDDNCFNWMCIEKDTGNHIGVFGLVKEGKIAEVSYLLVPEAQHQGYATEGIRALMEYAGKKMQIRQINAEIHEENSPSIHLVQKLGFTLKARNGAFNSYSTEVSI